MLNDAGSEVPHWVVPSFYAPMLGMQNNVTMELPCWASGCARPPQARRPLLTLTMIVKNEARKIDETISSVAQAAERVVILDTGSTDGTQGIIRRACKRHGLDLELYHEPFVDFSATRNRALQLAYL